MLPAELKAKALEEAALHAARLQAATASWAAIQGMSEAITALNASVTVLSRRVAIAMDEVLAQAKATRLEAEAIIDGEFQVSHEMSY